MHVQLLDEERLFHIFYWLFFILGYKYLVICQSNLPCYSESHFPATLTPKGKHIAL